MNPQGCLLSLSRDDAKRLFSTRDPNDLPLVVREMAESAAGSPRISDCGTDWMVLHQCLGDGSCEPSAGEPPLNQAILGGRQLLPGSDNFLVVVRPDMVPHVNDSLKQLDGEWLSARLAQVEAGDASADRIAECLKAVQTLYAHAAGERHCVVFTTLL